MSMQSIFSQDQDISFKILRKKIGKWFLQLGSDGKWSCQRLRDYCMLSLNPIVVFVYVCENEVWWLFEPLDICCNLKSQTYYESVEAIQVILVCSVCEINRSLSRNNERDRKCDTLTSRFSLILCGNILLDKVRALRQIGQKNIKAQKEKERLGAPVAKHNREFRKQRPKGISAK